LGFRVTPPGLKKEVPIGRLTLNDRELRLLLKEHGFRRLKDRGKGSHEIWVHASGRQVIVSAGMKDDIPPGTLQSILRQAGIDKGVLVKGSKGKKSKK
jgi:predicted RNA binding protein YcfA (HicA-like mRNA interferase family)